MSQSQASTPSAFCCSCGFWGRSKGEQGLSRAECPEGCRCKSFWRKSYSSPFVGEPQEKRGSSTHDVAGFSLYFFFPFAQVVQRTEGNTNQKKRKIVEHYPPMPCLAKHRRKPQKIHLYFARKLWFPVSEVTRGKMKLQLWKGCRREEGGKGKWKWWKHHLHFQVVIDSWQVFTTENITFLPSKVKVMHSIKHERVWSD